jgi:hypothetical protein
MLAVRIAKSPASRLLPAIQKRARAADRRQRQRFVFRNKDGKVRVKHTTSGEDAIGIGNCSEFEFRGDGVAGIKYGIEIFESYRPSSGMSAYSSTGLIHGQPQRPGGRAGKAGCE